MIKTLLIGGAMVDVLLYLPNLPESGGDIVAQGHQYVMGGCAVNVAQALNHFGCDFDLMVPIGTGSNAQFIEQEFRKQGWNSAIHRSFADNGICYTLIEPSGERAFITVPGIENHFQAEWFTAIDAANYQQVYISGYECVSLGAEHIIEWLQQHPIPQVIFCPGPVILDIAPHLMEALLDLKPIMHLNQPELFAWTKTKDIESAMRSIAQRSQTSIIVTAGAQGAFLYDQKGFLHIPTSPQLVVDTSGAGDAHIGTIMAELAKNANLREAIIKANRISGFVVQHSGPRPLAQLTPGVLP